MGGGRGLPREKTIPRLIFSVEITPKEREKKKKKKVSPIYLRKGNIYTLFMIRWQGKHYGHLYPEQMHPPDTVVLFHQGGEIKSLHHSSV
ncbi:hypothetical protein POVWA2_024030 [Plasmodium ovale wallikeri]|uniref:Uncharacterized protein n=1 Tax=Plasmodium ovale wallikeri TaxID=864142 RepID=A0A1A8YUK6_PLAOA|nr:hypothetical protein POVWA1_024140 [Plasmodium ovale wallikeri]SBT35231.1 hypothetical protein POVWA2_024030 [Plasmodium ovale wallikeri]